MDAEMYKTELDHCSREMIRNDGITILKLRDLYKQSPAYIYYSVPFMAMYCNEARKLVDNIEIDDDVLKAVGSIRDALKLTWDPYNRIASKITSIDAHENEKYIDLMRFKFMGPLNIHYNIGIWFDCDERIIGNTHFAELFISAPKLIGSEKDVVYNIGYYLGEMIMAILKVCQFHGEYNIELKDADLKNGRADYNTNKKRGLFSDSSNKIFDLYILHLTSLLRGYRHIEPVLNDSNTWKLRMEYVASHAVWSGLRGIERHFAQNTEGKPSSLDCTELRNLVNQGEHLFKPELRKCMMHYGFYDEKGVYIDEKEFTKDREFYGLFESRYNGESCNIYFQLLRNYMDVIDEYLEKYFQYDTSKLIWD